MINDDSHPNFFLSYINSICPSFFIKSTFSIFTFEKNLNFCSESLLHLFSTLCIRSYWDFLCLSSFLFVSYDSYYFHRVSCERIFSICFHGPWRVGGEERKGRHKENFMCSSNTWSNSSRVYSRRNSCPINITIKLATTKLEMALMPTFIATAWFR